MASDIPEPVTSTGTPSSVGIDDLAIHVPRLYLDMRDFAALRAADYDKLNKGLGLSAMAIPDVHEDTATMGAMAVMRLIDRNGLNPATSVVCTWGRNPHSMAPNRRPRTSWRC